MKAQFLPLFNVNLSQLQLNSISTKLPLNLISTSDSNQPQPQLNLNHNLNSIWLWHKSNPILLYSMFTSVLGLFWFKNFFWVYSCSWTTVISYVSFKPNVDFDFILGLFLTFLGPNGLFLGSMSVLKTVLGSNHVVEQLSFSMMPWIVTLEFDPILGSFLSFWGPNGLVFWSE